jgi:hypothetical protein
MARPFSYQRLLLFTFLFAIATCGAIGLWAVVFAGFNDTVAQILATSASVAGASVLGMAAAVPWSQRRWHPIGPVGVVLTAAGLGMMLFIIWSNTRWWNIPKFAEITALTNITAVTVVGLGLVGMARLHRGWEWVRRLTVAAAVLLNLCIGVALFAHAGPTDWFVRLMAASGILAACGVVAVPILHRVSAIRTRTETRTTALQIQLTCPRCALQQTLPVGRPRCGGCRLQLVLDVEEEHCPKCGYALYSLTSDKCPECGTAILPPVPASAKM